MIASSWTSVTPSLNDWALGELASRANDKRLRGARSSLRSQVQGRLWQTRDWLVLSHVCLHSLSDKQSQGSRANTTAKSITYLCYLEVNCILITLSGALVDVLYMTHGAACRLASIFFFFSTIRVDVDFHVWRGISSLDKSSVCARPFSAPFFFLRRLSLVIVLYVRGDF